jgi:hypothetical protein
MAVNLSSLAGAAAQFFDNNGVPLTGGLIYTYAAGTTTPAATYTSNTGVTAHANPIVLDAAGRVPGGEIWLVNTQNYKFLVKTSTNVQIGSYDNIVPLIDSVSLANTSNPTLGDALVGFRQSNSSGNLSGAVGRTVHQKLQESVSVKDFGAVGDGVTDDTIAIQAALDAVGTLAPAGGTVYLPKGLYLTSATINMNYANVQLLGAGTGVNHNAGGILTQDGSTQIIGSHVNNAVIRVWQKGCILRNFVVSSTATRRAATSGTNVYGIWCEAIDTSAANSFETPFRTTIEFVHVTKQPSHGILLIGGCGMSAVNYSDIDNCNGHGLVIDAGQITGRSNPARPGQVNILSVRSSRTDGCGIKLGDFANGVNHPYRINVNMAECFYNLENPAVYNADGKQGAISGFMDNCDFISCATGGYQLAANAHNGINISGIFNVIRNHRFINCEPYCAYVDDFGSSYRTADIRFETLYITNGNQPNGYYNPAVYINPDSSNVKVSANIYGGDVTSLITLTTSNYAESEFRRKKQYTGVYGSNYNSWDSFTIADDAVGYLTIDTILGRQGAILITGNNANAQSGMVAYRVGDVFAFCSELSGTANFATTTGALTGTTGADGFLTISADTATDRVYVENRTGTSRTYVITNLCALGLVKNFTLV